MTTTVRLDQYVRAPQPALPESQLKYLQEELRKLEAVLQGTYGALKSTGPYIEVPHAMLMSDQNQVSAGVTSVNLVTYNQPVLTKGVRVENNSQIWFDNPGYYLVTARFQFANFGNAVNEIDVWARNSGADYPLSNVTVDVQARKSTNVPAHVATTITGVFDVRSIGSDYLELAWWSDGADVRLESHGLGTNPTRPAVPSVILTTKFISGL